MQIIRESEDRGRIDIHLGRGNVHIYEDKTGINYSFAQPGWYFDTTSQLEAAALLAGSKFSDEPELDNVPFTPPTDDDWEEAAYWISGGNRMWRFHDDENFIGVWRDACKPVTELFKKELSPKISGCNSLLDLVSAMDGVKEDFYEIMYEELPELWDDPEE